MSFRPIVQRSAICAGGDLGLAGTRLIARRVGEYSDEAVQLAVESCDAIKPAVDQFNWRQVAFLDQPRYHVLDQVRRRDNLVALALRDSEPEPRQGCVEFRPGPVSLPSIAHADAGVNSLKS